MVQYYIKNMWQCLYATRMYNVHVQMYRQLVSSSWYSNDMPGTLQIKSNLDPLYYMVASYLYDL